MPHPLCASEISEPVWAVSRPAKTMATWHQHCFNQARIGLYLQARLKKRPSLPEILGSEVNLN